MKPSPGELGFLAKHPTTGAAIQSPYVAIANTYMTAGEPSMVRDFSQIVRENCTGEYAGSNPQDDVMERLLRARKGKWLTMFEKVNPAHPDKVADRIAGAVVGHRIRNPNRPQGRPWRFSSVMVSAISSQRPPQS